MVPESTALTTRVQSGSPYQLNQPQVLKASTALLHRLHDSVVQNASISGKKNLLTTSTSSSISSTDIQPIWLVLTTKHHITSQARLKPGKITLPHSLNMIPDSPICLIVQDPQRTYKDIIARPSFPTALSKRITKVIGIGKLKAKYKSFESRRQLRAEYDCFLADKRIITMLPKTLGKVFYSSGMKRPIPVDLEGYKPKPNDGAKRFSVVKRKREKEEERLAASPEQCVKEIERALACALVHLSPAATTSIKVALSHFNPSQVSENINAVVNGMTEQFVPKGWRNIKAVHIKGPNTMALPIWLADELWLDEAEVLENEEAEQLKLSASQKGKKRKARELMMGIDDVDNNAEKRKLENTEFSPEMKERREKLKAQKREIRETQESLSRREKAAEEGKTKFNKVKRRKIAAED